MSIFRVGINRMRIGSFLTIRIGPRTGEHPERSPLAQRAIRLNSKTSDVPAFVIRHKKHFARRIDRDMTGLVTA